MNRLDLKQYRYTQEWIKARMEYLEEYKSTITNISQILSDMPKGSRKVEDSAAEKIAKLIDSIDELINKINAHQEKQSKILEQLDKVEQPYRLILDKVYIQGKTLVRVADEMNYSYGDICRKHGIALKKFDKVE